MSQTTEFKDVILIIQSHWKSRGFARSATNIITETNGMTTYDDLIDQFFPHRLPNGDPSFRENQFEAIRDALDAFDDDDVDDVVIEAPTGAGKTSIAVTVARVMTRNFGKNVSQARYLFDNKQQEEALQLIAPNQAHMITSMKMLQDAYLGDDPTIKLVKGKSNYECHRNPKQAVMVAMSAAVRGVMQDFSCDEAEQFHGGLCERKCPYKKSRTDAQFAAIALHNFDSFLYQATLGGAFVPRRLLTIDEAHNSEEKIRNFMTINLARGMFESLDLPWLHLASLDMDTVTDWVFEMLSNVKKRVREFSDEIKILRTGAQGYKEITQRSKLAKQVRLVENLQQKMQRFYSSRKPATDVNPANWVASRAPQDTVILEPVDAGRFVPSALMRFGQKRLHLSATFLNKSGSYKRAVNLKMARARYISVPSTFPKERRAIEMRSAGKLGAVDWEKNFPNAVEKLKEILSENKDVRGVLHCTSYTMAEQFMKAMSGEKRLVSYDRSTRERVVNNFMTGFGPGDQVLLAVALTEGYDFKGDLCRFQIIVRVPYIVPTKCVKARGEKDKRFYGWRTSLVLVQTYGRGMRAADDHCRTYVLDERFKRFVAQERDQLPTWFLEAING